MNLHTDDVTVVRPGTSATCALLRRLGARRIATGQAVTVLAGQPDIPARWVMYQLCGDRIAVILEQPDLDAGCHVQYNSSKQAE